VVCLTKRDLPLTPNGDEGASGRREGMRAMGTGDAGSCYQRG
jgi:hypothetical protein